MEQIFRETAEDLTVLENLLKDKGVEVVRPKDISTLVANNQANGCIVDSTTYAVIH